MHSISIDEAYEKNDRMADRLESLIGSLDEQQIDYLPDGEKWNIANIVEHVSIVESGMIRICAKLLRKAETNGKPADGTISTSDSFFEKTVEIANLKLEAPEVVQPTREVSIDESMERLRENRQHLHELKPSFEKFDGSEYKFPHPFLGELSAGEWLTLIGGHKLRHIKQIEKLVGGI